MSHYRKIYWSGFEAITGIMPFFAGIMPFIMLHKSQERRKLDSRSYDNVKLCTQFSCLRKKHHE
jgi:hypothetical protein